MNYEMLEFLQQGQSNTKTVLYQLQSIHEVQYRMYRSVVSKIEKGDVTSTYTRQVDEKTAIRLRTVFIKN